VLLKPQGDGGDEGHLEDRERHAHEDTEGQEKLPLDPDHANEEGGGDKQYGPNIHRAADAIPIAQPAGGRAKHAREDPAER
jgi:hypothetical protein